MKRRITPFPRASLESLARGNETVGRLHSLGMVVLASTAASLDALPGIARLTPSPRDEGKNKSENYTRHSASPGSARGRRRHRGRMSHEVALIALQSQLPLLLQ